MKIFCFMLTVMEKVSVHPWYGSMVVWLACSSPYDR